MRENHDDTRCSCFFFFGICVCDTYWRCLFPRLSSQGWWRHVCSLIAETLRSGDRPGSDGTSHSIIQVKNDIIKCLIKLVWLGCGHLLGECWEFPSLVACVWKLTCLTLISTASQMVTSMANRSPNLEDTWRYQFIEPYCHVSELDRRGKGSNDIKRQCGVCYQATGRENQIHLSGQFKPIHSPSTSTQLQHPDTARVCA